MKNVFSICIKYSGRFCSWKLNSFEYNGSSCDFILPFITTKYLKKGTEQRKSVPRMEVKRAQRKILLPEFQIDDSKFFILTPSIIKANRNKKKHLIFICASIRWTFKRLIDSRSPPLSFPMLFKFWPSNFHTSQLQINHTHTATSNQIPTYLNG